MQITRTSPVSGITRTLDLNVTKEQINSWNSGVLIQQAFPNLTASEREFIKTGLS